MLARVFSVRSASVIVLCVIGLLGAARQAAAQTLDTTYVGAIFVPDGGTLFFDLTVNTTVSIRSLDVNVSNGMASALGTPFSLDVYVTAPGVLSGPNLHNAGAWTLVSSGTGTAASIFQPSAVDIADFTLAPGVYGVAIRYLGVTPVYTTGAGTFSNAELTLVSESAEDSSGGPFTGTIFTPRIWNGSIHYATTMACCDPVSGACTVALLSAVCAAGTVPAVPAAATCTPQPCPQPTACCNTTTGACSVALPSAACAAGSIPAAPAAATCTPQPCPQPTACCNTTTGACSVAVPSAACAAGSIPAAPATTSCTPQPCPQPTACCNTVTGVCSIALPGTACPGGTAAASPAATTCTPFPCLLTAAASSFAACADCTWINGPFDSRDGQGSHLGGGFPSGSKAADDFYLCEGFVYDLNSISATLFTTTFPAFVKPRAEIWSDCDGCPGTRLYVLDNPTIVEAGGSFGNAFDGRALRVIYATWVIDPSQQVVANRNIVLKGGTYWLSVYGLSDNFSLMTPPMYDVTYWGTTGRGSVKGLPAKKIDGRSGLPYNQFGFDPGCGPTGWRSVTDLCCIGCTDLAFSVCTTPCKILLDNGSGRKQAVGSTTPVGSTSQFAGNNSPFDTRTADDLVVPPCEDYTVCYVEGCILTNCPLPFEGVFEIYANDCHKPSYVRYSSPRNGPFIATKVLLAGFQATMDGKLVTAYKLEFHDLSFTLAQSQQYWISLGVRYSFSIQERAFFCYNADCNRDCLIRWNTARVLTAVSQDLDFVNIDQRLGWAALTSDCSFLIAAYGGATGPINGNPTPPTSNSSCPADFNRDGWLNTSDIFDYLTAWFTGCP